MSDRLLRSDERLLASQYYKFWLPSTRIPQGQGFTEYLEGRDLEFVDSRALNASAVTVVVRALEEKTYPQAASNMVGALAEATRIGLNVDQVVIYQVDGPPGLVDRAIAPFVAAGERAGSTAGSIADQAAAGAASIRGAIDAAGRSVEGFSSAARAIAIGIPIAAGVVALAWVLVTWRRK